MIFNMAYSLEASTHPQENHDYVWPRRKIAQLEKKILTGQFTEKWSHLHDRLTDGQSSISLR